MSTINQPHEQTLEGQQPTQTWQPGPPSPTPQQTPQFSGGQPSPTPQVTPQTSGAQPKSLQGLRGWLILVGIGLVITPLWIAGSIVTNYLPIFTSGAWGQMFASGSETYSPALASVLVFELLANLFLVVLSCLCAVTFFQTRKTFPKLYMTLLVSSPAYYFIDWILAAMLLSAQSDFVSGSVMNFAKALVPSIIWIAYMLKSRRVKATFIR